MALASSFSWFTFSFTSYVLYSGERCLYLSLLNLRGSVNSVVMALSLSFRSNALSIDADISERREDRFLWVISSAIAWCDNDFANDSPSPAMSDRRDVFISWSVTTTTLFFALGSFFPNRLEPSASQPSPEIAFRNWVLSCSSNLSYFALATWR